MADDNTVRSYRSKDSYRRGADPGEAQDQPFAGSDPLAELARLIGQSDPFTDNMRREPPRAALRDQRRHDEPDDWRRHVQRPSYDAPEEPPFDADARYGSPDPRYADRDPDPYRMTSPQDRYADPHADHAYPDPTHADHARADHMHADHMHADHVHADHMHAGHSHADYPEPSYAADEPIYAVPPQHGGYAGGQPPHAEEDYDDPPRRKRGSSLLTAVILIGCAMLGTAGAYGYRTYATSPNSKPAPVIIADSAPSKIVPSADQKSARSQERVGGQGNDERLVSREEQPVALPGGPSVPRVVFPSLVQPAPATTGSTPSASAAQADQPKRVRTVTIRPEGGDNSGQPTGNEAPARAAPPAARTAPQPPPRATRDQPLSLDPNAPAPAGEAARAQPQQRALTPPAPRETAAPAPAPRVAAVPPSGGSGGYLVQVSSQRSEADAQASYRALQAKYSQLKSHQAVIRRADLGNKGVYYRAMVPFETGEEAVSFCGELKQAGGQCIILRN
jgi:SPOR domain